MELQKYTLFTFKVRVYCNRKIFLMTLYFTSDRRRRGEKENTTTASEEVVCARRPAGGELPHPDQKFTAKQNQGQEIRGTLKVHVLNLLCFQVLDVV